MSEIGLSSFSPLLPNVDIFSSLFFPLPEGRLERSALFSQVWVEETSDLQSFSTVLHKEWLYAEIDGLYENLKFY